MTPEDEDAIEAIAAGMELAWNAANANRYAAYYDEDADFTNIYGFHAHGREAIAEGHDIIFNGVYAGSTLQCRVEHALYLPPDIALVHLRSHLSIPSGIPAPHLNAAPSMVMRRVNGSWSVAAFQNTLVQPRPS